MSPPPLRIAIVDDHPIFRDGLLRSFQEEDGFEVVGFGSNAQDALDLFKGYRPDAMLLDLSMPGGGQAALRSILQEEEAAAVIVLTASEDGEDLSLALQAGARGYVLKGVDAATLMDVVQSVVGGQLYISPELEGAIGGAPGADGRFALGIRGLTPRETQIVELVGSGASNKEIARRLHLTEKTVKANMTRILRKSGVRNRTEVALLFRAGRR